MYLKLYLDYACNAMQICMSQTVTYVVIKNLKKREVWSVVYISGQYSRYILIIILAQQRSLRVSPTTKSSTHLNYAENFLMKFQSSSFSYTRKKVNSSVSSDAVVYKSHQLRSWLASSIKGCIKSFCSASNGMLSIRPHSFQ